MHTVFQVKLYDFRYSELDNSEMHIKYLTL
jgi:hypothetical protein